ncbi:MAG: long-chain fatty acid--CoA ligase [Bdellovibrionales bacterium]|nr:long-chain fatty acid--CoA ligase [Bdellovibrionales bacterium]
MPILLRPTISATFLDRVRATPNVVGFSYRTQYREAGSAHPNRTWLPVTFSEFFSECQLVSQGLRSLGVQSTDRVALLSSTRYEWPLADMAILGASAVTVPIYPSSTVAEASYIVRHSDSKVIFVEDQKQLEKILPEKDLKGIVVLDPELGPEDFPASERHRIHTFEELKAKGRHELAKDPKGFEKRLEEAKPEDLITICYTSGTTGTPKGVLLTHDNLMSTLEDCAAVFAKDIATEKEVLVAFLPFSHIMGKVESMATYVFGWQEVYSENMETLATTLQEVSPTILFAVPRIFEKIWVRIRNQTERASVFKKRAFQASMKLGFSYWNKIWNGKKPNPIEKGLYDVALKTVFASVRAKLGGRLRVAICGGAPLNRELGELFEIIGVQVLEGYGLTETCAPVCFNTPEFHRFGSVGRPLPEVSLRIAEDGEIMVKSRKVFQGYFKSPEETAKSLQNGWLHTGDVGHIDQQGYVHITDRKKDLIVTSGGKNVAPQKLEKLAKAQPFIQQIYIHGDKKHYLTALITLDQESVIRYAKQEGILFSEYSELIKNPKIESLVQKSIDSVNSQVASFESIKRFTVLPQDFTVASGEMTPSLKLKRAVILEKHRDQIERLYSS